MLFNVPRRTLPACALAGAAGHATRALLIHFGHDCPGDAAGSLVIGFVARILRSTPARAALLFTVSGAIPMVPGSFAYRAMLGAIRISTADAGTGMPILVDAGINFVTTGLILAALALGIAMPQLMFRRRKPIF